MLKLPNSNLGKRAVVNAVGLWKQNPRLLSGAGLLLCTLIFIVWLLLDTTPDFGLPPDFAAIENTETMKNTFYAYLTPIVDYQNSRILKQRQRLQSLQVLLAEGGEPGFFDRRWLARLSQRYEIQLEGGTSLELVQRLLRRVDIIPLELALTQAAKESGWGRSRFAVEANNYFGQWCYTPGCGVVPAQRNAESTHEIQRFHTVSEAIRLYMNNLNSHERYNVLRDIRSTLRAKQQPVTGLALAPGLLYYSQRREEYVVEVRAMIERYLKTRGGPGK